MSRVENVESWQFWKLKCQKLTMSKIDNVENWKCRELTTSKVEIILYVYLCLPIFIQLFFCLILFTPDHHTFCSLLRSDGMPFIGWINHDIVVGLCPELLMRLSYNFHLGYGKKLTSHGETNRGPSDHKSSTLP